VTDPAEIIRAAAGESARARDKQERARAYTPEPDKEISGILRLFANRMNGIPTVPIWNKGYSGRGAGSPIVIRQPKTSFWRKPLTATIPGGEAEVPRAHGWVFTPGVEYPKYGTVSEIIDTYDTRVEHYNVLAVATSGELFLVTVGERPESYKPRASSVTIGQHGGPWSGSRFSLASWCGYSVDPGGGIEYEPTLAKRDARAHLAAYTEALLPKFHLEIGAGLAAVLAHHGRTI
jgi:hypothetical protein